LHFDKFSRQEFGLYVELGISKSAASSVWLHPAASLLPLDPAASWYGEGRGDMHF
jgi:hypothetical protein